MNTNELASDLEMTALGEAYFGRSLVFAKSLACADGDDLALLDRWITGRASSVDGLALQEFANKVRQEGTGVRKVKVRELLFHDSPGCTNHDCIMTKRVGMGTNGSCRCLESLDRWQLNALKGRLQSILDKEL